MYNSISILYVNVCSEWDGLGMGVDHGVDGSPQNLDWRGVVPPDFVMLQNFKHQITCITM